MAQLAKNTFNGIDGILNIHTIMRNVKRQKSTNIITNQIPVQIACCKAEKDSDLIAG